MPTSTFTPGDEKQEEKLNPGQQDYDRRFNDIAQAEERGTFDDIANNYDGSTADPSQEDANVRKLQERENVNPENPGWANNVTDAPKTDKGAVIKNLAKKKGPIAAILSAVGVGGFGISMLFSPSIMLVQLKETMMDKFNTQLTSMESRTTKLMQSKFDGTTKGVCGAKISVACRYSSMSNKEVERFKAAGIEVKGKSVLGRTLPESFTFNGSDPIPASKFASTLESDVKFRSAVKVAYNPRFAGFTDEVWQSIASRLGINKTRALPDGDDAAKEKAIEEETKSGKKNISVPEDTVNCTKDCTDANGNPLTQEEIKAQQAAAAEAAQSASESTERTAVVDIAAMTAKKGVNVLENAVKITSGIDIPCQAYSAVRGLGYAAKTVRAIQLARYAMIFLNTADQIKAGTAKPEDVAYLGGVLTTLSIDAKSAVKRKAAMDSFGVKYAMFGEVGKTDTYMSQFMAGGGLTGDLISFTNAIDNQFKILNIANPRSVCATLNNGWVQFGSIAAGIVLLLIPGANIAMTTVDVAKAVGSAALGIGLAFLPDLMKDIVAGTVTKNLVGEDAGNAIASGSGSMMSQLAQAGGNAAMSVDDAVAYQQTQNEVVAQYAADERATKSPLDASSKYTFLGSIVNSLTPYVSNLSTPGSSFLSVASLLGSAFKSVIPTSSAATTEQLRAGFTSCTDPDYKELGIATDPFCNVVYGVPSQYLNQDPATVAARLAAAGQINAETGEIIGDEFKTIRDTCVTSTTPLGSGGENGLGDISNDQKCKITPENADYYVYLIDQRVENSFDSNPDGSPSTDTSTTNSTLPTGTSAELAKKALDSGKVTDQTGQLQEIVNGTRTDVSNSILQVIAGISSSNTFTISSLKRDQALSVGAGEQSLHLQGKAVDLSGSAGINGVSFGYNGTDPTIQAFLDSVAAIMPQNCDIGVPNQAYVDATQPKVKTGCSVFVDTGTGAHIHLDVKGGS